MKTPIRNPDDVLMCNCADCGSLLCGESEREWRASLTGPDAARYPACVEGRIQGRPYCFACLRTFAGAAKARAVLRAEKRKLVKAGVA